MLGWQLTFYTRQDRKHGALSLAEWLMRQAHVLNIRGATLIAAGQGMGRDHKIHAARFFVFIDQPVQVQMVVSEAEADHLFAAIEAEDLHIFYVKTPIEFGVTCEDNRAAQNSNSK